MIVPRGTLCAYLVVVEFFILPRRATARDTEAMFAKSIAPIIVANVKITVLTKDLPSGVTSTIIRVVVFVEA